MTNEWGGIFRVFMRTEYVKSFLLLFSKKKTLPHILKIFPGFIRFLGSKARFTACMVAISTGDA